MTRSLGGQFLQNNNHFNANSSGNGIIFIMAGFSFAVIWSENVPVNADDICKVLPRSMNNNGVAQICLKKRLNFKSHVLFEAVRPKVVHGVLDFLKKNNALYYDIDINLDNIPKSWVSTIETNEDQNIPNCHIQKTKVINRDHITFIDDNQPLKISDFS